ncbi:MAG: VCBS domain-containing protein [Desulfovibrionales bacterium]|nr:VCBS domain-containing protein [Desulfovibrionales bacterium]
MANHASKLILTPDSFTTSHNFSLLDAEQIFFNFDVNTVQFSKEGADLVLSADGNEIRLVGFTGYHSLQVQFQEGMTMPAEKLMSLIGDNGHVTTAAGPQSSGNYGTSTTYELADAQPQEADTHLNTTSRFASEQHGEQLSSMATTDDLHQGTTIPVETLAAYAAEQAQQPSSPSEPLTPPVSPDEGQTITAKNLTPEAASFTALETQQLSSPIENPTDHGTLADNLTGIAGDFSFAIDPASPLSDGWTMNSVNGSWELSLHGEHVMTVTLSSDGTWNAVLDSSHPEILALGDGENIPVSLQYITTNGENNSSASSTLDFTINGTNDVPQVTANHSGEIENTVIDTPQHQIIVDLDTCIQHESAITDIDTNATVSPAYNTLTSNLAITALDANGEASELWIGYFKNSGDNWDFIPRGTFPDGLSQEFSLSIVDGKAVIDLPDWFDGYANISFAVTDEHGAISDHRLTYYTDSVHQSEQPVYQFGTAGDDLFTVGANHRYYIGGEGNDTISYQAATDSVDVHLVHGKGSNGAQGDSYDGIEHVIGSTYDDNIYGDDGANRIVGGEGADNLYGHGGNDVLIGGKGDDFIYAGHGEHDIAQYEGDISEYSFENNNATYSLNGNTLHRNNFYIKDGVEDRDGTDVVTQVEALKFNDTEYALTLGSQTESNDFTGTDENALFIGGDKNDTFTASTGEEHFIGGNGTDTANFTGSLEDYSVTLLSNGSIQVTDSVAGRDGTTTLVTVEKATFNGTEYTLQPSKSGSNATGSSENDLFITEDGTRSLAGYDGDDIFMDAAGDQYFMGGAINDTETDTVIFDKALSEYQITQMNETRFQVIDGEEIDNLISIERVKFADGEYNVIHEDGKGTSENDLILAKAGGGTVTGHGGDNVFIDAAGSHIFQGGTDTNTGTDTVVFSKNITDYQFKQVDANTLQISNGDEIDTLHSIETVTFNGEAFHLVPAGGKGTDGDDLIFGDSGYSTPIGGNGSDTFIDADGFNAFRGGSMDDTGTDTVIYAKDIGNYAFEEYYGMAKIKDTTQDGANGENTDSLSAIEQVVFNGEAYDLEIGTYDYQQRSGSDDTFSASAENSLFIGGGGEDTFSFTTDANGGHTVIGDFENGTDTLDFSELIQLDSNHELGITHDGNSITVTAEQSVDTVTTTYDHTITFQSYDDSAMQDLMQYVNSVIKENG